MFFSSFSTYAVALPRCDSQEGFSFESWLSMLFGPQISIQIPGMINYSSEQRKSRKTKKRPQRIETRQPNKMWIPLKPPKSTYNKYGSITSPIRKTLESIPDSNWTPTTDRIERIEPDTADTTRHSTTRTKGQKDNLDIWHIYRYCAYDTYRGGRYGVPFRLGLHPACSIYTPHKTHGTTPMLADFLQCASKTPSQHHLLPFFSCLLSKGSPLIPSDLAPKHCPSTNAQTSTSVLEYCPLIDYQHLTPFWIY